MSSIRKIPINTPGSGGGTPLAQAAPAHPHERGQSGYGEAPEPRHDPEQDGPAQRNPIDPEAPADAAASPRRGESPESPKRGPRFDPKSATTGHEAGSGHDTSRGHKGAPGHKTGSSHKATPGHGEQTRMRDTDEVKTGPTENSPADPTASPESAPPGDLEAVVSERDALNEVLLRLRAEFENYRKRSARELSESRDRAQAELLNDLLPVLDNLERALDAAEHHEESKVLGGVRMTRDMFVDLLRRAGVEEVETEGAPFDPSVHEAVAMQPSEEHPEGSIAAILQRGYRHGDRILRPARVVVSSGPGESDDGRAAG